MNKTTVLIRFLSGLVITALSFGVSVQAQDLQGPGELVFTVPVPAGLAKADVKDVVVTTLVARNWNIKEKGSDKAVGYLNHRGNEALVTLAFDDKKVEVSCVGWKVNSKGVREKPELPKGWLNNIKSDLGKRLTQASAKK